MAVYYNEITGELESETSLREQFDNTAPAAEHEDFAEYLEASTSWRGGFLTEMSECDLIERFDDLLDELNEPYVMAGMTFYPSAILKSDPIAYDLEFGYWLDGQGISTDDI